MDAKWIWENGCDHPDELVRFYDTFNYKGGIAEIKLACDSNYELYINGKLAAFGAYADYPYDKIHDRVDITEFCGLGKNELSILVWYYGADFFTYYKGLPSLIYKITENGHTVAVSSKDTLCRIAPDYAQGRQKIITTQMGFSFQYDGREAAHAHDISGYHKAIEVSDRPEHTRERPNKKLCITGFRNAVPMNTEKPLYDLGQETVGYLGIRFSAPMGAKVTVSWGEHLILDENGNETVPRILAERDFSVELIGNGESLEFSNYMRRIGCRYMCVESDAPLTVERLGLYEVEYPVDILPYQIDNPLRKRIYETSLRTLRLCMFEHYEDCPWREQSLYNMDSRNQMLCGYAAFGETEFPRASLELFGEDRREDGLLGICAPTRIGRPIPSFSLIFPVQLCEYAEFSGDTETVAKYYSRAKKILDTTYANMENGLAHNFSGEKVYWNFYEWMPTVNGRGEPWIHAETVDLCLNAFLSISSSSMAKMAKMLDKNEDIAFFEDKVKEINTAICTRLYDKELGLFLTTEGLCETSELANALAILCGAANDEQSMAICKQLIGENDMTPATISMKIWIYDALLKTSNNYAEYILSDIDKTYSYMLDNGATTFWETLKGADDFHGAGSLCHGWSAIPILYYRKLLGV